MRHGLDEVRLRDLTIESQDLQADALRDMQSTLGDLTEIGRSRAGRPVDLDRVRHFNTERRRILRNGGFGLGALAARGLLSTGIGATLATIVARPAHAQSDVDIQILQTAASLENLAVATYGAALSLPFFDENQVVVAFAETTRSQHAEHGEAFNSQAVALGGQRQDGTNPKYTPIVEAAKPTLTDYMAVVELAQTLEEVAQDTYLQNLTLLSDTETKALMGSVMAVETQHLATLRAVGALLSGGAPELIAIPTDVAALPAAAGSVAFPEPFEEPNLASPPQEGAIVQ